MSARPRPHLPATGPCPCCGDDARFVDHAGHGWLRCAGCGLTGGDDPAAVAALREAATALAPAIVAAARGRCGRTARPALVDVRVRQARRRSAMTG